MMTLPAFLFDRIVRYRARLHETPLDRYHVRVARTPHEYEDAFRLVHAAYVYQGIESVRSDELRMTPQHALAESTVLVAYEGDRIVGTMTVIADSSAGLPLDKDYRAELDALRKNGASLVEYGSLAVVKSAWHTGVTNLLNIAAYRIAFGVLRASHCVVGVHPRALPFYRALYGFAALGAAKAHAELRAPVQGLVQDIVGAQTFGKRWFGKPMRTGKPMLDHYRGEPLPCIDLPRELTAESLAEWKRAENVYSILAARREKTPVPRAPRRLPVSISR